MVCSLARIGCLDTPCVIAGAAVVGERDVRAGDDAFEAHQIHALAAFARRVLRHWELAKKCETVCAILRRSGSRVKGKLHIH